MGRIRKVEVKGSHGTSSRWITDGTEKVEKESKENPIMGRPKKVEEGHHCTGRTEDRIIDRM